VINRDLDGTFNIIFSKISSSEYKNNESNLIVPFCKGICAMGPSTNAIKTDALI